jgi:DNA (cytosine-5)-methyltransferase 1
LQSLDSLKELPKSANRAFAALGNAVNSKVVEMVARALLAENLAAPANGLAQRAEAVAA